MKKSVKKQWFLLLCIALLFMIPVNVQAASPSKGTVKKLYNELLKKNTSYTWFRTLDINQDGVKELVVSKNGATYNQDQYFIYTVKNNSVVYIGKIFESTRFGDPNKKKAIYYNKKLKSVRQVGTGTYSVTFWLYKINKYKLQERLCCGGIYNRYSVFYKSSYGKKASYITEKELNNFCETYFKKGCTQYVLYKNTSANRSAKL
ncbi:MAG: hypothetical protein Q4F24_17190 [Eubacteriales bacterium]|nr:hypothetical protein [Eubacteriales bacterium]